MITRTLDGLGELCKNHNKKYQLKEAAKERCSLKKSSTFNNTQIMLYNIVPSTWSWGQDVQTSHNGYLRIIRHVKQTKPSQIYNKWYNSKNKKKVIFAAFDPILTGY